jgi:hypothetical protein
VVVGSCVVVLGSWRFAEMMVSGNSDVAAYGVFGFVLAGPFLFTMLFLVMWLPASVGILIAEAFAIRSWIFHALNGAIAAWLGWQTLSPFEQGEPPLNPTSAVFGAGLAAGFAYWAVAGWNAGFWKPVFARAMRPPPTESPFNPRARTEA